MGRYTARFTEIATNGKSNGDNIVVLKDGSLLFQSAAQDDGKISYFTDEDHARVEGVLRRHQKFVDNRRPRGYASMDLAPPS